jgi:hypothetical protein
VPGTEKGAAVRTETSLVDERSRELVPGREGTAVNTSNLVVTKSVALVLAHEPLHTEEVQVPLVRVSSQITDLKTRVRLPSIVVAVSPPLGSSAADTADGNIRTDTATLTLLKSFSNVINLCLDDVVCGSAVSMVVAAVLRGDGDLEKGKESDQHGHHALGLAEVGHDVELKWIFL